MTLEKNKTINALITYFVSLYQAKFKKKPLVNRNKLKWGIEAILEDLTPDEVKKLMQYYVKVYKQPSLTTFVYEYDELMEDMNHVVADQEERNRIMKETEQRVKEYREKHAK